METWKLSGWNMKRFHKRRQVVLTHSIKALSLPQDQPLRLAFLGVLLLFFFFITLPFTPSFVTQDRCEGTSSPLSSGCRRLMDAFKCTAELPRCRATFAAPRPGRLRARPSLAGLTVIKSRCAVWRLFICLLFPSRCCSGNTGFLELCVFTPQQT